MRVLRTFAEHDVDSLKAWWIRPQLVLVPLSAPSLLSGLKAMKSSMSSHHLPTQLCE